MAAHSSGHNLVSLYVCPVIAQAPIFLNKISLEHSYAYLLHTVYRYFLAVMAELNR